MIFRFRIDNSCIPWWPLAGGILARNPEEKTARASSDFIVSLLKSKDFETFGREIVKRVEELAKKKGVSMAQISTAWVLANSGIAMT
jgi:aryl-alcohol dehydrogenase-like predicted oxidoreductase